MIDAAAQFVFWSGLAMIAYTYVGYPVLLFVIGLSRKVPATSEDLPRITLVIAAYNEELVIADKLENSLALDYPKEKLEILVVSDASSDNTDSIVHEFADRGIRLLRIEGRRGKTYAQNEAVKRVSGDVIVFSDANAMYDNDALRMLVRHFACADVGCVEGRRADFNPDESAVARHELSYRDYESWIKTLESRVATCTGATGPIYAVRRSAFVTLPEEMISDLMEPIVIRFKYGLRQVYEPSAMSREEVLGTMGGEFRRKIRIITRCLHSITSVPGLLNPLRNGSFALQIWSHRLLRWLVPVIALAMLSANLLLLDQPLFQLLAWPWLMFALMVAAGKTLDVLDAGPALFRLPYFFFMANLAALAAWLNWARGRNVLTWNPDRGT